VYIIFEPTLFFTRCLWMASIALLYIWGGSCGYDNPRRRISSSHHGTYPLCCSVGSKLDETVGQGMKGGEVQFGDIVF
jgi:hypothetical protein